MSGASDAEWCGPPALEPPAVELARDRLDHRHLERLGRLERRQEAGKPLCEHRLAGAGRADEQEVVYVKTSPRRRAGRMRFLTKPLFFLGDCLSRFRLTH
jgi:hypothetical protein